MTSAPVSRTDVRAQEGQAASRRRRTLADRLLAAFPLFALGLAVLVLYAIEASTRKTPTLFTDELEWTQISRSIAATGHAARRTEPIYFKSLYAYVIAPFWWWFSATPRAYTAIKYANAVLMPLAAIPTYLLARMLVSKRNAVLAALLSVCVPAMAYAGSIVPEVIAYPYFALCSWLAVRALASRRRLDVVLAVAAALGGYFIRQKEFSALPVALVLSAAGLWLTGPRGREWRRNWTRGDTIGAIVIAFGAFFLFNRVVLQHVNEWQLVTQYYKNRMVDLGLRAGLSLTIGLGLLPVVGGLAALRLPERRGDPVYRAFAAWSAASIFAFAIYTADKAAYLSTNFATLWEERNMIYLAPLLLVGTMLVFEARRLDRLALAAAAAFVLVLIVFKPIQTSLAYYEAPGSTVPALLSYYEHWTAERERWALVGLLVVCVGLLLARRRRVVLAFSAVFLLAWTLSGEIGMTVGLDHNADTLGSEVQTPPNWVDVATGGKPVTLLGQSITDQNPLEETEFWNRTIDHVNDLDGTAPGPGPHSTIGLEDPTGVLSGYSGYPYVLAYNGVTLAAPVVAKRPDWILYRKRGPWRLTSNTQSIFPDGWCGRVCNFTYYVPDRKGTVEIGLSRSGYNGTAPAARVTVRVGTVRLDENHNPQIARLERVIHTTVPNATSKTLDVPVAQTPVRIEIRIPNPIPPGGATPNDPRELGAQVSFTFVRSS